MRPLRRWLSVVVLTGLLLLAACGDGKPGSGAVATPDGTPTPADTPGQAAPEGGSREGSESEEADGVDPGAGASSAEPDEVAEEPDAYPTDAPAVDGPPAPDFTLALADGSEFTLSAEQRAVYLIFWAEW